MDVPAVQVAVTGRNCEIRPTFRAHAEELLSRVGKFDDKATRVDVEVCREQNPRLADSAYRVDLTLRSKGKVIRAEAAAVAADAALDLAWQKLQLRLRRSHRRRVDHMPRRGRVRSAAALQPPTILSGAPVPANDIEQIEHRARPRPMPGAGTDIGRDVAVEPAGEASLRGDGPFLLRENRQAVTTMSVDEALSEMERTGQELFTFVDRQSGQPCVLHRSRGYTYGLVRLDVP